MQKAEIDSCSHFRKEGEEVGSELEIPTRNQIRIMLLDSAKSIGQSKLERDTVIGILRNHASLRELVARFLTETRA